MCIRDSPNTLLTTVGMVEKKAPLAAPLMTTKTMRGASVVEVGQIASIVTAVRTSEIKTVLSEPSLSLVTPERIRPKAEARLKPATNPAPMPDEKPMDSAYSGIKKGATKRGNVPIALPINTRTNTTDLKSDL